MHETETQKHRFAEEKIRYAIRTLSTTSEPLVTLAAHAVLQYRVRYHLFFALSITFSSNRRTTLSFSYRQSYRLLSGSPSLGDEAKIISDDEGHHARQTVSTTKHYHFVTINGMTYACGAMRT